MKRAFTPLVEAIYLDDTFASNFAYYDVPMFPMNEEQKQRDIDERYSPYEQYCLRRLHVMYESGGLEKALEMKKSFKKVFI